MLVGEYLFLGTAGTATLLTAYLLRFHLFGGDKAGMQPFYPVKQKTTSEKAVKGLGTFLLAFYRKPRRQVDNINAG